VQAGGQAERGSRDGSRLTSLPWLVWINVKVTKFS
jgi:hypothetical protein